jgi:hypothetical protein
LNAGSSGREKFPTAHAALNQARETRDDYSAGAFLEKKWFNHLFRFFDESCGCGALFP